MRLYPFSIDGIFFFVSGEPRLRNCAASTRQRLCNAFRRSTKKREDRKFAGRAENGQFIYSSIAGLGYRYVVSATKQNEYCLARPGFNFNDQENEYINHLTKWFYRPFPFRSLTVVDL